MIKYPDVQERLYNEILRVTGGRRPSLADRPNLDQILHDSKDFPEDDKFKPERFLNQDGKLTKIENNIVFGFGKRDCLGKTLAASQLFIFLSGLLADFKFRSTDEDHLEKLDLKPNVGFTLTP